MPTDQTAPIFNQDKYLLTWLYGIRNEDKIGLLMALRRDAEGSGINKKESFLFPVPTRVIDFSQNIRTQLHVFRKGTGIAYHGMDPVQLSFSSFLPKFRNMNSLYAFFDMMGTVFSEENDGYSNYLFALNINDITMTGYIVNYRIQANDPNYFEFSAQMIVSAYSVKPPEEWTKSVPDGQYLSQSKFEAITEVTGNPPLVAGSDPIVKQTTRTVIHHTISSRLDNSVAESNTSKDTTADTKESTVSVAEEEEYDGKSSILREESGL